LPANGRSAGRKGWLDCQLPNGESARLTVYSTSGRMVLTEQIAGAGAVTVGLPRLAPGVYVARLTAAHWSVAQKLVVLR